MTVAHSTILHSNYNSHKWWSIDCYTAIILTANECPRKGHFNLFYGWQRAARCVHRFRSPHAFSSLNEGDHTVHGCNWNFHIMLRPFSWIFYTSFDATKFWAGLDLVMSQLLPVGWPSMQPINTLESHDIIRSQNGISFDFLAVIGYQFLFFDLTPLCQCIRNLLKGQRLWSCDCHVWVSQQSHDLKSPDRKKWSGAFC